MKRLLLPALVCAQAFAAEPTVLSEVRAGRALQRIVLVTPESFSPERVARMAARFSEKHPDSPFLHYVVCTSSDDAALFRVGKGVTDWTFPMWLGAYKAAPRTIPATAEMVRMDGRESIRIRERSGRITERILKTGSPFRIAVGTVRARLLSVTFHKAGSRPAGFPDYLVSVCVQSDSALNKRSANSLKAHLVTKSGFPWLQAYIEDGWWFSWSAYYPVYNRFLPHLEPPTYEAFRAHTRWFCSSEEHVCAQAGPAK